MSWGSDDGRHEGYVLAEFVDGVRARGVSGGGVPQDHVVVDFEYVGEPGARTETRYTTRPAAEAIGWRVMCDCRENPESSRVTKTWVSELLTRVPSKALEDAAAGRIFALDGEVIDVDESHYDALHAIWRRDHVDELDALATIREARRRARLAQDDLDAAARSARAGGSTWEAIGRAAGMARQSAQERWG